LNAKIIFAEIFQDLGAGEANSTSGDVRSGVLILLGTNRTYHYIASKVAKFLSLDVFSQIYMG
jgi:hypothetical protein